jgi:hypothetical protein
VVPRKSEQRRGLSAQLLTRTRGSRRQTIPPTHQSDRPQGMSRPGKSIIDLRTSLLEVDYSNPRLETGHNFEFPVFLARIASSTDMTGANGWPQTRCGCCSYTVRTQHRKHQQARNYSCATVQWSLGVLSRSSRVCSKHDGI